MKIIVAVAFLCITSFAIHAQVQTKISQMPILSNPSGGYIPVIKGGLNYRVLVDSIKGQLSISNVGSGFRLLSGVSNLKSFVGAGKAALDSSVAGQIRITVPATLSSYTNDAGFLTAVPGLDAVTTGGSNNVTLHSLTVGDLTSYDNLGGSSYVQVSGLNQRITFSGTSLLNLYRTNISGTTKSLQFPNISGNLAEGVTDGTNTVHAGTDGAINISTLPEFLQWHLSAVSQTLIDGATVTMNCSNGYIGKLTLTGNHSIVFTNVPVNRQITIHVFQDATGNRTLTFPANTYIPIGFWNTTTTPNLSTAANAWDVLYLNYDGTNYTLQFSKYLSH